MKRPKKRREKERKLRKSHSDSIDYSDFDLMEDSENQEAEETKKNLIDLKSMEICRICLFNDGTLVSLFKTEKKLGISRAEMMDICLSVEILEDDEMPTKICRNCLESLKVAYRLKRKCLESQELMQISLEDSETYRIPESRFSTEDSSDAEESRDKSESHVKMKVQEASLPNEEIRVAKKGPKRSGARFIDPTTCRPIKCYLCDCDFETTPEDHFKSKHTLIQSTKCSKCEFETEFPWYLNLHYQIHADDKRLCMYCGNTYSSQPSYQSHLNHCKGRVKVRQRLSCSFCSASYWNPHILREHERIHTNEVRFKNFHNNSENSLFSSHFQKPYVCDVCGNGFIRRIHLRKHMVAAHNVSYLGS